MPARYTLAVYTNMNAFHILGARAKQVANTANGTQFLLLEFAGAIRDLLYILDPDRIICGGNFPKPSLGVCAHLVGTVTNIRSIGYAVCTNGTIDAIRQGITEVILALERLHEEYEEKDTEETRGRSDIEHQ